MKKTDQFGKVKKKSSNNGSDLKIRQIDLKHLSSSLFALSLGSIKRNKKYTQKYYLNNQNFKLIPINNRRFCKKMHSTNRINNYYSMPRQKQLLDNLKRHKLKTDFVELFCSDFKLQRHLQFIFSKSNLSTRKNTCLRPAKFNLSKNFQNLDTLYNVSINDTINYSICSETFTTTAFSGTKNCQRALPLINLGNPRIENFSVISSDAAHAHSSTFTQCLKHLTSILIYLKINQKISYLNNKIDQFVSSDETKGPVKRNYLKKIILKPNMLDFNSFNMEGFVEDLDMTVKKKPKLKEACEVFMGKKRVHLDSNNSHTKNQIDQSDDLLHHTIGHDIRCFSEPPNLRLNKSLSLLLQSKSDKYFLNSSPTIKILFNKLIKKHNNQIFPMSNSQSLCSIRIEDFFHMYKCKNLLLKRSFSSNRIKLDKEVVKKSPSFEKFLKNILQGKKKSNSLCNFSSGSRTVCNDQSSTRDSNSSLSDNLDNMMVSMMNGKKKSSWPVLKIEDQEKNFEQKTNMEETEANNDGYIPENVRNALEQAGINIDEIINMTNQLQMSFKKDSDIKKSMVKSHTFSNEQITTTRTIFTNEEKNNFETKLENLIDNIKSFEVNEQKTNGQLVSVSSLKNFEIKQNLRAKMSQQVENKNEPDQSIPVRPARNNRKKSASNRYATVSNFRLGNDHEAEISPCWNSNYCSAPSAKIIPAKVVGQFKPIVNIHKRLSATPVAEMTKMINSKSTDTFSNLTDCSDFTKEEPEAKFIKLSESGGGDVISSVDLTENLPTRQIKKGSVIRSFSYNIGNIYEEGIKCKKPVSDSDSFGKVIELCKNKKALFSVNESLDMSEAENVVKNCMETKNFSGLNTDRANPAVVVGRLNSAISQNKLPNIKMNQSNKNLISLLGSFQDQTITISKSKSSINLPNSFSTSSLSGVLHNEFEIYQNNEEFLRAKRQAIVVQMYDTEKSYVEALKILVNKYYLPLKEKDIVDRNLINDIFYKIPEIHVHHELFLSWLKTKFDTWDSHQTIGDILFNIFAKQSVIETYISFVNNYRTSQEAIRISKEQSSIFCKFLEQQTRDHRGKLTLKDLIIQPVQRIPRYELYIKDFLKCTPPNHPDHQYLIKAQTELHNLAEKIDQVHKEVNDSYGSDSLAVLQIIQDLVENLDDLVTAYRYYIRHDMLTIVSSSGMKKDRCLFLFSDLVILTSCKRRSGNINKKPNTIILNSPIGKQYLENSKHKLIMKFQLEDIDLTNNILTKKLSIEKDILEEDLSIINRINEIAKNISYPHQILDECLRDLSVGIKRQLTDTSAATNSLNSSSSSGVHNSSNSFYTSQQINSNENTNANESKQNQLVLTINTMERMEIMTLIFNSQELKWNWEKCFIENKKFFYESFSRKPASFLSAIAIPRNRSGVNFTCASPRFCNEQYDVWICNTDGKMSQICILNTNPELAVTSCNTISNSKISCIQCVPPYQIKRLGSSKSRKYLMRSHKTESTDTTDSRFDSATIVSSHSINSGFLFKEESLIDYDSSDDEEKESGNEGKENHTNQNPSQNIPNHGSLSIQDLKNCTMWIGNEDGSLNIFQFNDSTIRTVARKNRITKQFSAGINSIAYIDNKVIVSLKNGELVVFKRLFSIWNFDNHLIKALSDTPFSQMITVAGKLWCASNNIIKILNPETLDCENQITIENEKSIYLAAGGNCTWAVWVACLNTLDLKLYHVTKFTVLADINIKQCVVQKLAGIDEIIRIHKIHTLKITCCYICKDTLWIGTTAGVIVNIKIPHINNSTVKLNTILNINGLNQGHIGPVRFISSTEVSKQQQINKPNSEQFENSNLDKSNSSYKTVVITGGEGFEEYKAVSTLGSGISLSNSNASNLGANFISENPNNMSTSGNSILSSVSGNTSSYHQISNSSISDEFNVGKEDLVNYVLTWET